MIQKILILLFLIPLFSFSQNKHTISGIISDKANGETMIGATVLVKEMQGIGAATNLYGYYSILIPDGNYTLIVSFIGYENIEQKISLQSNVTLNFKLKSNATTLQTVEISAEKKNSNITSEKTGVEKVEMKDIKKIPVLFGEQDVLKTLQLTPGVKSTGEGSGGLFVRGGSNSQNLILLDEATVYNANHLMGFFSTFNSDAIKDLTLYKGTASAEYGGRISSVMDIRMNDGNNQTYHVSGGIGLISSKLNIEGPIVKDNGSFLISGRRSYADLFLKLSSNEMLSNSQLYFYDLNAKLNYKINEKNRIYLSGYMGRDVIGVEDRMGIDWGNMTGTLRWNHLWNGKLFSNTSFIYSDYSYQVSVLRGDDDFSLTSIIKNWNFKHEFQYFLNTENTISFGLNSFYHSITPGQVENSSSLSLPITNLEDRFAIENAIYVSNNWKPSKAWNICYGIRFSTFSQIGPGTFYLFDSGQLTDSVTYTGFKILKTYYNPEPRLNATYIINPSNSLKFSYTRNTQNLHMISNSTSSTPTDIWISSSLNIQPEIGDQISLGYYKNFKEDIYQFSGEIYYKWMQNQLDLKNGAEIRSNEYIEGELLFGIGRAYGLELMLKKRSGKFTGWLAYTLSRTERKIDGINNGDWYVARQDATHDLSIVGIYELTKKWTVSATWVYNTGNAVTFPSGKYFVNGQVQYYYTERNGYRMPAYHRLDLGATYIFKKRERYESSLSISLYNAYGQKNAYTIDFEEDPDDPTKTIAVKTYLFTYVPSISYNFKF